MTSRFKFQPVVIIGAGRSGTNMLRDLLCTVDGVVTWPCDEINYIWRHGNIRIPHDEFSREHAREGVCRYIRNQFSRIGHRSSTHTLVEKTCANTLRVGFVDEILPEAKYVFIVRHGLDVTISAMKRWNAGIDIPYVVRKARYVPWQDFPYYSSRYFGNRLYRLLSGKKRLAYWGPKFKNFESFLPGKSLAQICAQQWKECVERADAQLNELCQERVHRVRYEDFVRSPQEEVKNILNFVGVEHDHIKVNTDNISTVSVGQWVQQLDVQEREKITQMISLTLNRFGYESDP